MILTALKNTLLNKFAIETLNNKLQEVTLQDDSKVLLWIMPHYIAERIITAQYKKTKLINYRQQRDNANTLETCTFIDCDQYRTNYDGHIDITRQKRSLGIQYKDKSKEDIAGFISKPVARPEYGTIYQHKDMLLQNLHHRYLYITIKLPHL